MMPIGHTSLSRHVTPNNPMKRTFDRILLSLPLQSVALKHRLSPS